MDKVYTVLYTQIEADDFQNPYVDTKVFDTQEKAEAYLKKDYDKVLGGLKNGDTVYDIVDSENYGNNAEILLGEVDEEGDDFPIVEVKHTWRVYMDTVNYEGREDD